LSTWTSADGDILFSKHKPKGGQKIQYAEFVKALHDIATKKKITYEAVCGVPRVCASSRLCADRFLLHSSLAGAARACQRTEIQRHPC